MCSKLRTLILALLFLAPAANGFVRPVRLPSSTGKVFLTVEEALQLAFPGAEIKRRSVYLSAEQKQAIAKLARLDFKTGVVFPYEARKGGKLIGTAYFDTHRVRTLRETLMVVVLPSGKLGRVELLSFAEPRDYIPHEKWYRQFDGKALTEELNLKRAIKPVTGATLTARATTSAARRVLALHTYLTREPTGPKNAATTRRSP